MLKAIIEHKGNTLLMDLPCKRTLMAEELASIGVMKISHKIKCTDEEDAPIKVKIFGEGEFESKLASLISADNTLSFVNTLCEIYQALPYQNKLDEMEAVLSGEIVSFKDFGLHMVENRMQDTTENFYCPLAASLYTRNEYGDLEEYPEEYDGRYLVGYEEDIRDLIAKEDSFDESNLAEYFDGSNTASAKLKSVHFSTQNVSDVLYGKIRAELTAPFTAEEEAEFKDWLIGQCSDGYGEGLEQRPIKVEDGELYVSFWQCGDDYFMLNEEEFNEHLTSQTMGGME